LKIKFGGNIITRKEVTFVQTKEFKKDLKTIQNMIMHPTAAPCWKELRAKIEEFMNVERRTWASTIFYLLEKGLEHERNGRTSGRDK
jgi:hypothetical protein